MIRDWQMQFYIRSKPISVGISINDRLNYIAYIIGKVIKYLYWTLAVLFEKSCLENEENEENGEKGKTRKRGKRGKGENEEKGKTRKSCNYELLQ